MLNDCMVLKNCFVMVVTYSLVFVYRPADFCFFSRSYCFTIFIFNLEYFSQILENMCVFEPIAFGCYRIYSIVSSH